MNRVNCNKQFFVERRRAIKTLAGSFVACCGGVSANVFAAMTHVGEKDNLPKQGGNICKPYFPLFCVAYITPDNPNQMGQEHLVSRYPMAIVPQNNKQSFRKWRDRIKNLNPSIKLLGYQMVIEETTVPGPGHDYLRRINKSWATYPFGFVPEVGAHSKRRRIFDPRSIEWQDTFLEACIHTIKSYPYDGLFLDQCSIFKISHPNPMVRNEMRSALQKTLLELRRLLPDAILIGNSRTRWVGLNGEMCEGTACESIGAGCFFEGHNLPRIELVQKIIKSHVSIEDINISMQRAHALGMGFGVSQDYQHVLWYDIFDDVMDAYKQSLKI